MDNDKLRKKLQLNRDLQEVLYETSKNVNPLLEGIGLLSSEQVELIRILLSSRTDLEESLREEEFELLSKFF